MLQRSNWVLDMLKHVVRYNEVERRIAERAETRSVIYNVSRDQGTPVT
jgi:hypothetical protein